MQPETMDDDGDPVGIIRESEEIEATLPSNEYVLNVAFFSFMVFVLFQAIFALIAHSESMLADSEAMSVDALTYLFNLCAERLKHRPLTSSELSMPVERRCYQRELRRLYLELIPPTASVATLVFVTFITLREALATLRAEGDVNHEDEDVSIPIMLYFSAANLLLDVVNVTCFARAHSTFGLDVVRQESTAIKEGILSARYSHERLRIDERSRLLPSGGSMESELTNLQRHETSVPRGHLDLVNLNMCSAWTHVCADTLRSTAVLVAAAIATFIPSVPPEKADSVAAVAVSVIIFGSLIPLIQGLIITAMQVYQLHQNPL